VTVDLGVEPFEHKLVMECGNRKWPLTTLICAKKAN